MELQKFKETLLEFLGDVTIVPEKSKNWFLDKPAAKELFNAPNGYKVFSPFVLVKIETSTIIPDRPKTTPEEGQKVTEEESDEKEFFMNYCIVEFKIHTETHCYYISATWKDNHAQYIGCIVQTRKYRVGENHVRGNDLPDGYFCRETWERIKDRIIKYEMKALSKYIVNGRWTPPLADKEKA